MNFILVKSEYAIDKCILKVIVFKSFKERVKDTADLNCNQLNLQILHT